LKDLSEEVLRTLMSTVKAELGPDFTFYMIIAPRKLTDPEEQVVAIGNLQPAIVVSLLRSMANGLAEGHKVERFKTS